MVFRENFLLVTSVRSLSLKFRFDYNRTEVSENLHENQNRFYIVHEESLLCSGGITGHSHAPQAFLLVDVFLYCCRQLM